MPKKRIKRQAVDITEGLKKIRHVVKRANTLPWLEAGNDLRESIFHNFDVGGRMSDVPGIGGPKKWKKRKDNKPHKILDRFGYLKISNQVEPRTNGVSIASRGLDYNRAQNLGYPGNNLPRREFQVAQPQDIIDTQNLFERHLIT